MRYRLFVFSFFFDVSERKFVKSYRYHKVVAFAARADFALVQLSDFLHDRKPDAAAFDARRPCPVASEKPCEIFVEVALFNVFGVVSEFQNDDSFQFRNRLSCRNFDTISRILRRCREEATPSALKDLRRRTKCIFPGY